MRQIDKQNCIAIGRIQKVHGLKGEVIAWIEEEFMDSIESAEYVFIDIDEGLVPFFICEDGIRYRNNETIMVQFDFIKSTVKATELAGHNIFVFKDEIPGKQSFDHFEGTEGMEVIDKNRGNLGMITSIDDYSGNVVITVTNSGKEILIPLNNRIISRIDSKNRILYLECPEGLIDIYLE